MVRTLGLFRLPQGDVAQSQSTGLPEVVVQIHPSPLAKPHGVSRRVSFPSVEGTGEDVVELIGSLVGLGNSCRGFSGTPLR